MANTNMPRVYLFPFCATGHLIPMIESAKRLLHLNSTSSTSFSIHIIYILLPRELDSHPSDLAKLLPPIIFSYLQSFQAQNLPIHIHPLPLVEPPRNFNGVEEFLTLYVRLYLPLIKATVLASPSPISALIFDMFATDIIDVAKELNIPPYIYSCSAATFLSLGLHLSSPNGMYEQVDFSEVEEEICVPSLTPIPSISIPTSFMDMKSSSGKSSVYHFRRFMEAKGIIVNSNIHIEKKAMEALATGLVTQLTPGRMFPEIYPIGPVISFDQNNMQKHKSLEWLDKQPAKSVVFLCLGSSGADFEASQVQQIATGLEQSGHRFLWVLLLRGKKSISGPADANAKEILPDGFLERTKERGMVWFTWIHQTDILSHEAIGGFVTHCGWNSILESLWFGVPMIAWPLYAEQHLNAFHVVKEMHVAIELEFDRKNEGFASAMELERAIKRLMEAESEEGRRVRNRAEEVMSACRKAVQRGGVSHANFLKLAGEFGKVGNAQPDEQNKE